MDKEAMQDYTGSYDGQDKPTKVFVPGMFCKLPNDKAPDFILLEMSFKGHEFFEFCQENMSDKGWTNITVKRSQKGTIYAELNNWTPKTQLSEEQKQTYDNRYQTSPSPEFPIGVNAYNHPLTTDKEREEMEARDALEGLDQIPF